jgi:hypothetical protein
MHLVGVRVLLIAKDLATPERLRSHLVQAGARLRAASCLQGLSVLASQCDVVVLFDDFEASDEMNLCWAALRESRAPLLVVTQRRGHAQMPPREAILAADAHSVAASSLLDAIRARVRSSADLAWAADSAPELPFTD